MALAIAFITPAYGQRLNLQSTGAPPAGSGAATLALADSLDQQIGTMRQQSGAGPAAAVSIALRALARDLLRSGEAAGEAGSVKIILARTIADQLAALDARAAEPSKLDAAALTAIAGDLERISSADDETRIERALRDALAPMTQTAAAPPAPAGWFERGNRAGPADPLVRWAAGLEITDPLRQSITSLDERLRAAQAWVAYEPAARRAAALVRVAAGPIERRPAWMTVQARRDLEDRLVETIAPLSGAVPAEDRDPAAKLRRVAQLARLMEQAAAIEDSSPAARDLRAALMEALKQAESAPGEGRRFATLERALGLAARRRELERDSAIIRQLKPALRALTPAARESEVAMLSAARRLLSDDESASDPAVLNAISAHQRRVDDLALIVDLNRLIAVPAPAIPGERPVPGAAAEYKGLADWIFQIGQDLTKPGRRDLALAELREVAGGAVETLRPGSVLRLRGLTDQSQPRRAGPALAVWDELSGDRSSAIADAADKARASLIAAWTSKDVPRRRDAERRARQVARVAEAIDDAAWSRTLAQAQQSGLASADLANLQQWPGWQVSLAALPGLGNGLPASTRGAVDKLLAGSEGETESAVRTVEARFAVVLLAGRLQRLATEAGLRSARPGPGPALLELGLGPPDPQRSWMVTERPVLAAVCRYAEEWAAAAADPKQEERAGVVKGYLDNLAARTLERIRAAE